jgi:excisionase family DNA binding protein
MEKAWLRVSEIAKDLDMSEETVRAWILEGKLKGAKFGRDYRIRREDYQEFILKHFHPGSGEQEK